MTSTSEGIATEAIVLTLEREEMHDLLVHLERVVCGDHAVLVRQSALDLMRKVKERSGVDFEVQKFRDLTVEAARLRAGAAERVRKRTGLIVDADGRAGAKAHVHALSMSGRCVICGITP